MQIKIQNTRMDKKSLSISFDGTDATKTYQDIKVPVAEAKLVLIETNEFPKENQLYRDSDLGHLDIYFVGHNPTRIKMVKPILISETECTEFGDSYVNPINGFIGVLKQEKGAYEKPVISQPSFRKILALPEHFSPKHLQMIVDGKLKDGDKVLVECEDKGYEVDMGGIGGEDVGWMSKMVIKFNSSNHITLHKVEEEKFDFNKIHDLRPYLLNHPDKEMVRSSCLHYLGDKFQAFDKVEEKIYTRIEIYRFLNQFNQELYGDMDRRSRFTVDAWFQKNVK